MVKMAYSKVILLFLGLIVLVQGARWSPAEVENILSNAGNAVTTFARTAGSVLRPSVKPKTILKRMLIKASEECLFAALSVSSCNKQQNNVASCFRLFSDMKPDEATAECLCKVASGNFYWLAQTCGLSDLSNDYQCDP